MPNTGVIQLQEYRNRGLTFWDNVNRSWKVCPAAQTHKFSSYFWLGFGTGPETLLWQSLNGLAGTLFHDSQKDLSLAFCYSWWDRTGAEGPIFPAENTNYLNHSILEGCIVSTRKLNMQLLNVSFPEIKNISLCLYSCDEIRKYNAE